MLRRRLSQTLGQIRKGYAVDTYQGGFPITEILVIPNESLTISGALSLTDLAADVQVITSGFNSPLNYQCLLASGTEDTISGNVKIKGTHYNGEVFEETIAINGKTPVASLNPYKEILSITLPAQVVSGEKICVGFADRFGAKRPIYSSIAKDISVQNGDYILESGMTSWEVLTQIYASGYENDLEVNPCGIYVDKDYNTFGPESPFEAVDDPTIGVDGNISYVTYLTDIF